MGSKVEYFDELDEDHAVVEQLDPGEYYDEDMLGPGQMMDFKSHEKPVVVAVAPKKPGTIILKPGTITLPKKKLIPIHDKQKVKQVLEKYKSMGATVTMTTTPKTIPKRAESVDQEVSMEVLNDDSTHDDTRTGSLPHTSLRDRFLHRKRVMGLEAKKTNKSIEVPAKQPRTDSGTTDTFDFLEGHKIYWDSEKDMQKINPTMFDTEILDVVLHNQVIADIKQNYMYKTLMAGGSTNKLSLDRMPVAQTDTTSSKKATVEEMNFSQIPVRNADEFVSLETELREKPESVLRFEAMLENLGSPENYSELIKYITSKLFTPNFMEQLGWAQNGVGGLQLKESLMKESIYNVFAKKYEGVQEDILNEKFSQHFRSFRLHRSKNRSKQRHRTEQSESSS